MMIEKIKMRLRPCPFCGGAAELIKHVNNMVSREAFYSVVCESCGVDVYFFGKEKKALRTAESWNRRADYDGRGED